MLIEAPISRFATPTSPFASFSLLLLQPSSMEVLERVLSYPMNPHTLLDQIHHPFKGKNKQQLKHNCVGNRSVARNNRSSRGGEGHHGPWQPPRPSRGYHHGPWWSPRLDRGAYWLGCTPSSFGRRVLPSALNSGLLVLGYLHWAFWAYSLPL